MTTLFIADLHLSEDEPAITAGFLAFLQREAIHADALYILGDLFELWIGDDSPNPLHDVVANALAELKKHHVPVYYIHGNRDFLIGQDYAHRAGMQLLPEVDTITLYGKSIVILHGDTLCTDDIEYQRYRRRVYNPLIRRLFLWLPLAIRQRIANKMRRKSSAANQQKSEMIMDVNSTAVKTLFAQTGVRYMVHGHTHRPAVHEFESHGETYYRLVLGAWHTQGSVIRFHENQQFELDFFPF